MRAEIEEEGPCQPSLERYGTQQRLLGNPRWMAASNALLDVAPGEEATTELTCHHSAVLVREPNTRGGDHSVAWHTDSSAVPMHVASDPLPPSALAN